MSAERPAPLRGYIMPLLTPFNADGSVDEQGMRTNIAYLIGEGIHGITLTGSFGEFPLLTEPERIRLYEVAVEEAAGRCTVIAGTAHARTDIVIELGDAAARVGMDGVMMTPPHYLRPSDDDLRLAFRPHRRRVQAAGDDLQQPAAGGHQHVSVPARRAEPARQRGDHQAVQPGPHGADRTLIDRTDGQDGFFVTNGQEPRALPALVMGADANYGISPLMLGREVHQPVRLRPRRGPPTGTRDPAQGEQHPARVRHRRGNAGRRAALPGQPAGAGRRARPRTDRGAVRRRQAAAGPGRGGRRHEQRLTAGGAGKEGEDGVPDAGPHRPFGFAGLFRHRRSQRVRCPGGGRAPTARGAGAPLPGPRHQPVRHLGELRRERGAARRGAGRRCRATATCC